MLRCAQAALTVLHALVAHEGLRDSLSSGMGKEFLMGLVQSLQGEKDPRRGSLPHMIIAGKACKCMHVMSGKSFAAHTQSVLCKPHRTDRANGSRLACKSALRQMHVTTGHSNAVLGGGDRTDSQDLHLRCRSQRTVRHHGCSMFW